MNVLFVCTVARMRSRTAWAHFRIKRPEHKYRYCGIDVNWIWENRFNLSTDSFPITIELVKWADRIIAMESRHSDFIEKSFGKEVRKKTYTLNIKDMYDYMDQNLIKQLDQKVKLPEAEESVMPKKVDDDF